MVTTQDELIKKIELLNSEIEELRIINNELRQKNLILISKIQCKLINFESEMYKQLSNYISEKYKQELKNEVNNDC